MRFSSGRSERPGLAAAKEGSVSLTAARLSGICPLE